MNAAAAPRALSFRRRGRVTTSAAATLALLPALMLGAVGTAKTAHAAAPPSNTAAAPALPTSVLLFPATITGDTATGHPGVAAAVTASLDNFLQRGGVGVVEYNRRLPAVQRAVSEGMKPEDAAKGPGDDPRMAKTFVDLLGANEYVTVFIDDYKYDPGTRTATYTLSVTRMGADGSSLGASSAKAVGIAPADVPASRQEVAAAASAADVASEQVVEAIYPGSAGRINPPKDTGHHKKRHGIGSLLIPAAAVVAAVVGASS